jgi:hypothetical protein
MKLFTCNNFKGHWPVGSAAVIVAKNHKEATRLLREELEKRKLPQDNHRYTIEEVNPNKTQVLILHDGNY